MKTIKKVISSVTVHCEITLEGVDAGGVGKATVGSQNDPEGAPEGAHPEGRVPGVVHVEVSKVVIRSGLLDFCLLFQEWARKGGKGEAQEK